jgi:hypothetical protein
MVMPNLFEYATSELSQDAMLCWLAAWAQPEAAELDPRLHELGLRFVGELFRVAGRPAPVISSMIVQRQHKHIDVLLTINSTIAVCIEDKAGSVEHGNQLERYIDDLKGDNIARTDIVPVYVQTMEQGSYTAVEKAGYGQLSRKDLLEVLGPYVGDSKPNAIAWDFYKHLARIEEKVESFRTQPTSEWNSLAWQGFFCELQQHFERSEWGFVSNPAGGFPGFWWYGTSSVGCEQYLQLERERLCFKIEVSVPEARSALRTEWSARITRAGSVEGLEIVRPTRLRAGQSMTVAVLEGDYRVTDGADVLDLEATLDLLKKAEAVLDRAVDGIDHGVERGDAARLQ